MKFFQYSKMINILLFLFLGLFKFNFALNCIIGTTTINATYNTNITGDSCISGYIDPETQVFTFGNCSIYQTILKNLTCCNNYDNCNQNTTTISIVLNQGSCNLINSSNECISRTDCYWCNSIVSTNIGSCRNLLYIEAQNCFVAPLFNPPPKCGSIECPPIPLAQQYNVSNPIFTKKYLTDFQFPALSYPLALALGADILSRQVRIANNTASYCVFQAKELNEWCGVNDSDINSFPYCLASEIWPQTDIGGWLLNTTFSSNRRYHDGIFPLFNSLCVCNTKGRAYYLPFRRLTADQMYTTECPAEAATLLMYIILIVISIITLIYVIWDICILVYLIIKLKDRKQASSKLKTLFVKIIIILYFLITIPTQALYASPNFSRYSFDSVITCLRVLGYNFVLFSFSIAVITYLEILLDSNAFGELKLLTNFLTIFKWIFLSFASMVFIVVVVLTALASNFINTVFAIDIPNLVALSATTTQLNPIVKAFLLLLISYEFILIIVTSIFLGCIFYLIKQSKNINEKIFKELYLRFIGLFLGLIVMIPDISLFGWIIYEASWIEGDLVFNPFGNAYNTRRARVWSEWALMTTELILMWCILYSMRTRLSQSWLENKVRNIFQYFTGASSLSSLNSDTQTTDMTDTQMTSGTAVTANRVITYVDTT
jgi:hypothetical protein